MENIIPPTTLEKKCSGCKEVKSLTEFPKDINSRDGFYLYCKQCACKRSKKRYDDNGRDPFKTWEFHLKRTYGITPAQYEEMLTAQEGVCAICGQSETATYQRTKVVKKLSVDHDHKTGKIRALLCRGCNMALGHLNEDAERAQKLAEYIMLKRREE
jgi:hypothetical protein